MFIFQLKKNIHLNKTPLVHALNIDILNKWSKLKSDRLSRSRDIVETNFGDVVAR